MKLPKIKSIHSVIFLKNRIRIGMGSDYSIEIENPDNKYTNLIKSLNGQNNLSAILRKCDHLTREEVEEAIENLYELGHIEDNMLKPSADFTETELSRYSVNLNYFSTLDDKRTDKYGYQRKLSNAHVLVLGIGGIGSNICLALVGKKNGRVYSIIPNESACFYCQYLEDLSYVSSYSRKVENPISTS